MKYEELNKEAQRWIRELKHGSSTIENNVADAIAAANNTEEFFELATDALVDLINETTETLNVIERLQKRGVTKRIKGEKHG